MEQLFNFFTKYNGENGEIIDIETNEIICKDQNISILELSENISSTLLSKGIDKISKLILVGNAFLQFCDFSSEDINSIFYSLEGFLSSKNVKQENENLIEEFDFSDSGEFAFLDDLDLFEEDTILEEVENVSSIDSQNTDFNKLPLDVLNLSCRTYNCLKRAGVDNLGDLLEISDVDLHKIRNLGVKSIKEIILKRNEVLTGQMVLSSNLEELCEYYSNITINSMNLSVRSYNCLKNHGINYLVELFKMTPEDIRKINSLGSKSYNEIIEIVKKYKKEYYDSLNGNKSNLTPSKDLIIASFFTPDMLKIENEYIYSLQFKACIYDDLISNILNNTSLVAFLLKENIVKLSDVLLKDKSELLTKKGFGKTKYDMLYEEIKKYINDNIITQGNKENLRSIISKEISIYVQNFNFHGVRRIDAIDFFSTKYEKEDILLAIESLIEEKVIFIYEEDKLFFKYDSFPYFLYQTKNELTPRLTDIMFLRIDGETLENIAKKYDVTRELVRQQCAKFIKKYVCRDDIILKTFKEDKYAYLFQNYLINKADFVNIFSEKERTFNYLNMRYQHGKKELSEALDDILIPKRFRACIQKFLDKDFVFINNNKIPKERTKLLAYYVSKNILTQTRVDDIIEGFNAFVMQFDESLQIIGNDHLVEPYINRVPNIVASLNKQYRYYDFSAHDWEFFLNEINLEGYEGLNIYSTLLFRNHPKLMEKYNILDCYELHNILRKLYEGKDSNVSFGRMPNITIGKFDRKEYMISILEEYGELSSGDFAKILDERLGLEIQATFWISELKEYHEFGKYIYHQTNMFDSKLIEVLSENLIGDFYFKNEIEEIVKNNKLNPDDLKNAGKIYRDLGYLVNSSYIVKKPNNAKSYFNNLLTKDDILEYETFKKFRYLHIFSEVFTELRTNYDIIQFDEQSYINFRKLQAFGFSKQDLNDYCESVISNVETDYFTIKLLKKLGFNSELEELGFGNIFYESILKYCSKISYFRMNNVFVFKLSSDSISKTTFISEIIEKYRMIETDDLIYLLKDSYGISVDIYDLKEATENTNIYYNSIMDTFYVNYNVFIEEV